MHTRGWLLIGVAIAAVFLLVGRTATALFVDHAWFTAMGVPSLFWERVLDSVLLQGGAWVAGSLFAFANLHAVRRTILAVAVPSRVANIELTAMVPGRRLLSATIVVAMIIGAVLALPLTNWDTVALVRHGLPFGEIEGIFDRDLGHYVYWLPFEETLYLWSLVSLVTLTATVLVLYALTRSLRLEGRRLAASNHVRRHLSVLGALVLLLLAWSYRLDAFDLLQQGSGPDGVFLRVDHRVTLRMDAILSYGSAIAAFIILRTGWAGQLRAAFVTLTAVLVAAVGLRHVVPAVIARSDMLGDPSRRDQDYVASRALYSRRAFDVDGMRIVTAEASKEHPIPTATSSLVSRVSLWDHRMLVLGLGDEPPAPDTNTLSAAALSGSSRMIDAAPVGWTVADGRLSALLVRRPMASAERWTLSLVDVTRAQVRDSALSPPRASDDEATGAWPLVGPGVQGARLLDAAEAPAVQGTPLRTVASRIAHAWALRNASLLGADTAAAVPLLVTHRDVRDRVARLAPIFVQGDDVLPLRDGGRLYWVLHLYSASDRYPLSQRWMVAGGAYAYFKLAATALVDANSGRVQLVATARPDAIAKSWMSRWPSLFTAMSALPGSLAAQLPPATDGAVTQVRTFARYGSRMAGEMLRHVPDSALTGGTPAPVALQSGSASLVAWAVPLLDADDQLAGMVTATGGADRATLWTPAPVPRLRWRVVLERLAGALDSGEAGTGDPTRREAPQRRGQAELLVTEAGVLVRQVRYTLLGDGSAVVTRVAVTNGTAVAAGATLAEALRGIGADVAVDTAAPVGGLVPTELAEPAVSRLYDSMRRAMQRGDWTAFGAAFDSLGRVLGRPPQ